MFFDELTEIERIASRCGTAVFVVPKNLEVKIKQAIILQPEEKNKITIEQVRGVLGKLNMKQIVEQYIVIRPAELMNIEAANALLKSLEEPGEKVHFILITDQPSSLLPTILSRAGVFILRREAKGENNIAASEKVKELAKKLMVARGTEVVTVAEEITRKKDGVRNYALEILGAAIEMSYKSYFITKKEVFLKKVPKFLLAYDNICKNGHVKLQIIASLC